LRAKGRITSGGVFT
jgi:hypothetical protein